MPIQDAVSCFIKEDLFEKLDLSINAKVLVFGRPLVLTDRDNTQKTMLNIYGVYTYPEFITPKPKEIKEEDLKEGIGDEEFN